MASNRVHPADVTAAVRKKGFGSLGDVACVALETDGTFSVLDRRGTDGDRGPRFADAVPNHGRHAAPGHGR